MAPGDGAGVVAGKRITLQGVADRIDDLKNDFNEKHKENVDRRHALVNSYSTLEGRVTVVETKLTSIVGDNSGGSGLLHEIDRKVDGMRDEVTAIKKAIEDAPAMRKWVFMAAGVVIFLGVIVPVIVGLVVALLSHH